MLVAKAIDAKASCAFDLDEVCIREGAHHRKALVQSESYHPIVVLLGPSEKLLHERLVRHFVFVRAALVHENVVIELVDGLQERPCIEVFAFREDALWLWPFWQGFTRGLGDLLHAVEAIGLFVVVGRAFTTWVHDHLAPGTCLQLRGLNRQWYQYFS